MKSPPSPSSCAGDRSNTSGFDGRLHADLDEAPEVDVGTSGTKDQESGGGEYVSLSEPDGPGM